MFVSLNIDEISFPKIVAMVNAHEMKLDGADNHTAVNLAVSETTRQKPKKKDDVIKMICVLHQVLHELILWQGHEKYSVSKLRQESGDPCINTKVECYECRGNGHFKRECPTANRRRFKSFRWKEIEHVKEREILTTDK